MQLYDPTSSGNERHLSRAPALAGLQGLTIGILENGKLNATEMLGAVARLFEERHGPLMWTVPVRPEPTRLAEAINESYTGRQDPRVGHARDVAIQEYSAPVMGRRWSDLIGTLTRIS